MTIRFAHSFPEDCPLELEGPVVSIYFPTHQLSSKLKIDQTTFKNLLKEAKTKLNAITDSKTTQRILEPLEELLVEPSFWIYNQEACAIFANQKEVVVYRLFEDVKEKVVVASSVYIKPLVRIYQLKHHYFIIGLTQERFELFEVFNENISPFAMDKSIKKTVEEVLGTEKTESYLSASSYGGVSNRGIHHGHGGQKEENDIDAERFFRYVDKTISENISSIQSLPMILCTLKQNQQHYRRYAKDANLLHNPIETNFESLSLSELKEKGDEIINSYKTSYFKTLLNQGQSAVDSSRYTTKIEDIVRAINESKIQKLYILENKKLEGSIDWDTNKFTHKNNDNDVYGDCAEACIKREVDVYILPETFMPTTAPIFAIVNP